METLWDVGLANALIVAAIVPVAALAEKIAKRPAWAHTIWLIVLLKLVTPPIAGVPIGSKWKSVETPRAIERAAFVPELLGPAPPVVMDQAQVASPATFPLAEPIEAPARPAWWWLVNVPWRRVLGAIWLGGSVAWLILAAWRIGRFARAMRQAEEAPDDLTDRVGMLASRLGMARAPIVILSPGQLAPMVWAMGGRARLFLPESLWKRLDDQQRAALLIHELAHLKRRDHWVRLLELLATGLFWWHPALWLARKRLHRAEEECCDLWVVWALPEAKKTYATTLVETVEFLSETRPRRLPVGASGMGQVEDLSRRIGMIMRGDTPRGLSRAGFFSAIGLAVLLLPWRPTLAQQESPKPDDVKPVVGEIREDLDLLILKKELVRAQDRLNQSQELFKKGAVSKDEMTTAELDLLRARKKLKDAGIRLGDDVKPESPKGEGTGDQVKNFNPEYHALRERLRLAQAMEARTAALREKQAASAGELDQARAQVQELMERLAVFENRNRDEAEAREQAAMQAKEDVAILQSQVQTKKAELAKAIAQHRLAGTENARLERLEKKNPGFVSIDEKEKAQAELAIREAQIVVAKSEAEEAEVKLNQAMVRAERVARMASPASQKAKKMEVTKPAPSQNRDADKRLDELESKLDRVLKELDALRKEKSETPVSRDESRSRLLMSAINQVIKDEKLTKEEVARRLFMIFFHRDATAPELWYAKPLLAGYRHRETAVYEIVLRIAPSWFLTVDSPFLDQLAADEKVPFDDTIRSIYRALRGAATGQEVQDFLSHMRASGTSRRDAIGGLVQELTKTRGEPQPILEATQ